MYTRLLFMMQGPMFRRSLRHLLSFLLFVGQTAMVCADDWKLPTQQNYRSENGKHVFRVTPNIDIGSPLLVGRCRGALYVKDGKELRRKWERPLVNDLAPYFAVVSDSGKCVVTLSEWADLNSLPIVFYGPLGDLTNVYGNLDQVVSYSELRGIPGSMSGFDWLTHALCLFGPNDDHFVIRLSTGKVIVLETETGKQIDDEWQERYRSFPERFSKYKELKGQLRRLILMKALRLASSEEAGNVRTGLFVLGQYKDKKSISILLEATKDNTSRIIDRDGKKVREYPIRKAAKEALEAAGEKVPENVIVEERIGSPQ